MNIKSLLLGSAAALAVVSGAQAADAIVAAEPEPMEYVRVCDAFGTGFFYIPGTETCLKIGGEVRVEWGWNKSDDADFASGFETRARVNFTANSDSEVGVVSSYIQFEAESDEVNGDSFGPETVLEKAYISVGGFKTGYTTTFWDDIGFAGEADGSFSGATKFDMVSYTYATDAFTVGIGFDEVSETGFEDAGVEGMVSASLGAATLGLYGVYDFANEEGAVGLLASADVGPGSLSAAVVYASGDSVYDGGYEWAIGGAYAFKATDKLTITPGVSYYVDEFGTDVDAWEASLYAEYAVASGLTASINVEYGDSNAAGDDGDWNGFVRLIRSF
ncbi:porin [Rhizobium rosettiformans]|uniref:porin n=1 Tax=Rhizobium rosettiformans TaxID=1368430 RepID=UPI0028553F56|nr:porin [Rhizobium rosettiformans]MDR7026930.1 hypothetical protein [Rhizobium rosettiformans]MDR7065051.1 hypothetical protein [Rhizobium rosettiformans]